MSRADNTDAILLNAEGDDLLQEVSRALGHLRHDASTVPGGDTIEPTAIVLAVRRLSGLWFEAALERLRRRAWLGRTVLVTEHRVANVRRLAQMRSVEVVLVSELKTGRLDNALRRVSDRSRKEKAIGKIRSLVKLDEQVAEALVYRVPPCTKVAHLARELFCSPGTVRARWRRGGFSGTPKAAIEHVLLVRIAWALEDGIRFDQITNAIGIHRSTGYRLVRRVLGCTPNHLSLEKAWDALEDLGLEEASGKGK